ncbi:DUF3710 domain-containing protein [Alloscardovia venturai]|uniref:DUF3710 domain-containing protein n=1 Tax=Alloscardovia venturai TaxID=1769421 RepID=A0ABW2Y6V3_9BIFI
MGLFGFGKSRRSKKDNHDDVIDEVEKAADTGEAENSEDSAVHGPWDINDENAPDYDEYLNMGALYLPFLFGIELRLKASTSDGNIISATITYGKSSLEMEVFAAPKSMGLWDDIRTEFLENRSKAQEKDGVFGKEILLPVHVQGTEVVSRIVGVDGPRWMVRGIFTGPAATDEDSEEKQALDKFFSDSVINRGSEPLAPRDRVFLSRPLTPSQMKEMEEASKDTDEEKDDHSTLELPEDPDGYAQQSQVKQTLRRGPLFSEMR